jgi:DNA-binding IclR family transcriptional regulator
MNERGDAKKGAEIQSLVRASALLREIARNRDGIGLAQLSRTLDLHTSTAFHLLKTLVNLGYVRQD